MEFPHLKDTKYPNFNNVDVYAFRNEFDYTRWGENTRIRLVNVLWDSNYNDVVKFESDEERDAWFDSIDDKYDLTINTFIRIIPDGTIKLPIPYDVLSRYNYCYVDIPIATSEERPIDYENDWGYRRWYFFINDISYRAPNTTVAYLAIDVWTQFINDMEFKYLMLERGHAPVAFSDVDEYLSNPIENNQYLLTPDVTFDNAGIVKHADFVPIGNGEKYVCFASFCSAADISKLGTVTQNSAYSGTGTPTYSNTRDRWGYQYKVNNYGIGTGYDYSKARTPATIGVSTNNKLANNVTVYAIPANEVYGNGTFFTDVMTTCPQFLNTVVACFVISKEMIMLGNSYTIAGHTLHVCNGNELQLFNNYTFKKEDFKFDSKYQNYAKLYTHPYSVIEVTDNAGSSREFYIEESGKLSLNLITSVAFPFLNTRVWFDGIGGSGSSSYKWAELNGANVDKEIANSRWFEWCLDWAIPTFTLYMDGKTAFQLANFNRSIKNARESALVAYENAARSANTSYENAIADSNVANTNAHNTNDTALANTNRSADTEKANVDASMNTLVTNQTNTNNTTRTNADIDIQFNSDKMTNDNYWAGENVTVGVNQDDLIRSAQNLSSIATTTADVDKTTNVAVNNGLTSAVGAGTGIIAAAGAGLALGGPVGAVVGGGIAGIASVVTANLPSANATVVTNAAQATVDASTTCNTRVHNYSQSESRQLWNNDCLHAIGNNTLANSRFNRETNNNITLAATNTGNTANTNKNNATRTQTTTKTNASATNTTGNANADRTKSNSQANSGYSREAAILNAKNSLEQSRNSALASLADAGNSAPKNIGYASGDFSVDYYENRGLQIMIKTQNKSAIAMTGDTFARYGYMLNQVWDMSSGFNLMKNFTYWKASDVWIDDINASNTAAQNSINAILVGGTTVWSNPEKIGKVSLYDN